MIVMTLNQDKGGQFLIHLEPISPTSLASEVKFRGKIHFSIQTKFPLLQVFLLRASSYFFWFNIDLYS